jgi:hypothetical protein
MDTPTYEDLVKLTKHYGERKDCAVKAISQVCGVSYEKAHNAQRLSGRKFGSRTKNTITKVALNKLGFSCKEINPLGKRLDRMLIPSGKNYLIYTSGHIIAVKNGEILDFTDGSRRIPIRMWEIESVKDSESIEEKVIGHRPPPRKRTKQKRYKYTCEDGCVCNLSQTLHNKILRGQYRWCLKHQNPIKCEV